MTQLRLLGLLSLLSLPSPWSGTALRPRRPSRLRRLSRRFHIGILSRLAWQQDQYFFKAVQGRSRLDLTFLEIFSLFLHDLGNAAHHQALGEDAALAGRHHQIARLHLRRA